MLELHPDRLLPAGQDVRGVARAILSEIESLPIVSPHGHLDAAMFVENRHADDPAGLLVTKDHYVVRLLHAHGVPLAELGLGRSGAPGRPIWGQLCRHWRDLAGTPSRLWLEYQLHDLFGLSEPPSPDNADETYELLVERLASDELAPRALSARFGIEVLTTTDSPLDDLASHRALAEDPSFTGRLLPTFRPDAVVDPANPRFVQNVARLGEVSEIAVDSYGGYLEALRSRREAFRALGATASDHGVPVAYTEQLEPAEISSLYRRLLRGDPSAAEIEAFRGHMLDELARMATEDGMVMQLHIGVQRDYSHAIADRFGPDVGQDFPLATEFTTTLRPLLARYGERSGFKMVLYTVDETTFSREIGPLVSWFPSLFAGAPWWFLDAPDTMSRAFVALGETAGMAKLSGFVDDTRSLLGIGARHDVARRICAGHLARLVCEHRLGEEEAVELAAGYAYHRPRAIFGFS
jgi:glucuronate isomerase